MLTGRSGWHRAAMQALEGRLSDAEAAQFRWWAWALRRRRQAASRVRQGLVQSIWDASGHVLVPGGSRDELWPKHAEFQGHTGQC